MRVTFPMAVAASLVVSYVSASELRILAWNVESGSPTTSDHAEGTKADTIAGQLEDFEGYDIVALTEVNANHANQYIEACGEGESGQFEGFRSNTGGGDRQVIAYNAAQFELIDGPIEVHEHDGLPVNLLNQNGDFRFRSPMYVVLKDNASGVEFIFMVVHLARSDTDGPNTVQSTGLRAWVEDQQLPVIIAGDANYDYDIPNGDARPGLEILTDDDIVEWVKPDPLVDTNWADRRVNGSVPADDDDRTDQFQDSVLDFVFASGGAKSWSPESDIIVRDNDLPDTGETSDHRPVEGRFELPDTVRAVSAVRAARTTADSSEALLKQILERLSRIEKRLDAIEKQGSKSGTYERRRRNRNAGRGDDRPVSDE